MSSKSGITHGESSATTMRVDQSWSEAPAHGGERGSEGSVRNGERRTRSIQSFGVGTRIPRFLDSKLFDPRISAQRCCESQLWFTQRTSSPGHMGTRKLVRWSNSKPAAALTRTNSQQTKNYSVRFTLWTRNDFERVEVNFREIHWDVNSVDENVATSNSKSTFKFERLFRLLPARNPFYWFRVRLLGETCNLISWNVTGRKRSAVRDA